MATVTKPELIEAVANAATAERRQVESILNAFFDQVRASAKSGDKIGWPGFGSFSVSERAARTGRNPRTGEAVKIKASKAMKFSSSSQLKDFLNTSGRGSAAKKAAPASKASTGKKAAAPAKKAAKATKKR